MTPAKVTAGVRSGSPNTLSTRLSVAQTRVAKLSDATMRHTHAKISRISGTHENVPLVRFTVDAQLKRNPFSVSYPDDVCTASVDSMFEQLTINDRAQESHYLDALISDAKDVGCN